MCHLKMIVNVGTVWLHILSYMYNCHVANCGGELVILFLAICFQFLNTIALLSE